MLAVMCLSIISVALLSVHFLCLFANALGGFVAPLSYLFLNNATPISDILKSLIWSMLWSLHVAHINNSKQPVLLSLSD